MAGDGKFRVEKFNGQNFSLWNMQREDYLYQKDLYLPLGGKTNMPMGMTDEEWNLLDRKCIKPERHRYTWFTQFGLRPPQTSNPSFLLSSKMKRDNLQQIHCNILCFLSQSHLSVSRSENTHIMHSLNKMPSYKERGFPSREKNPKPNISSTIRSFT